MLLLLLSHLISLLLCLCTLLIQVYFLQVLVRVALAVVVRSLF